MRKKMQQIGLAVAAMALTAVAVPASAQSGSILDKAITPPSANWTIYGPNQSAKGVDAKDVVGGHAIRIDVRAAGANPWDVGANQPIAKPIKAGDVLLLAVYMRAPALPDGASGPVSAIGVAMAHDPYTPLFQQAIKITNGWKIYYASGRATQDWAGGTQQIAVQLADEKRVIELGPSFLLDFGPDQDLAKLPHNQ